MKKLVLLIAIIAVIALLFPIAAYFYTPVESGKISGLRAEDAVRLVRDRHDLARPVEAAVGADCARDHLLRERRGTGTLSGRTQP